MNIDLNQLLRYGFAGAFFIAALLLGFEQPAAFLFSQKESIGAIASLAGAGTFAIGAAIYSIHRAFLFPWLNFFACKLAGRVGPVRDIDLMRWERLAKNDGLQFGLKEWAAQVHFLYCLAISFAMSNFFGDLLFWKPHFIYPTFQVAAAFFLLAGFVQHVRYQLFEEEVHKRSVILVTPQKPISNGV